MSAPAPLTPIDVATLQAAHAELQAGRAPEAELQLRRLAPAAAMHPDALHLFGLVLGAQGRRTEAREALARAAAGAPKHPHIWNSLGNLLGQIGEGDAAIGALERAVALAPGFVQGWTNLGLVATRAGRYDAAARALDRAAALAPGDASVHAGLGALAQAQRAPEAAAGHFGRAVALNPGDTISRHNLAAALRALDRATEALAELDRALAGPAPLATAVMRGHVLGDLGRFDEAVEQYRTALTTAPGEIDAHETLAALLPQLGRGDEALDSYRAALRVLPESAALWRSAVGAAKQQGDHVRLREWTDAAERALGPQPDLTIARSAGQAMAGDRAGALRTLLGLEASHPDHPALQTNLAHAFLLDGDLARAERYALRATQFAPLEQAAWAYLTIIWRLTGDAREHWLADYERLVMPIDLDAPAGWPDRAAFLTALRTTLTKLHVTRTHPADQSLRGGTQTRGNLFDKADPVLRALGDAFIAAVDARLAALPEDATHPFLRRNTKRAVFAGSWSVRLRSEGFHISHIHASGWLSSAFYVGLPPEMKTSSAHDKAPAGALTFGVPDAVYGLDLAPRRVVVPQEGRLVIFPSYLWHGTLPFSSEAPRLTVAFDALPVDSATPRA